MPSPSGTLIDDIAYLARSEHRITTLVDVTVRPRSRSELWEAAGVSSSTIRRTLREFEDRQWIRREDYQFEATELGAFIAAAMADLIERLAIERELRPVWKWLPDETSGFNLEMCLGAKVTRADAEDPFRPVSRFLSLVDRTETLRFAGLDIPLLEPSKESLCRRIIEGLDVELIEPPRVVRYIRSSCPDLFSEALASGNLTVRLHDDLPSFGVGIFDDRVAIIGHDPENVTVRVLVDTDEPAAREWATSIYETHSRRTPTVALDTLEG